MGSLVGSPKTWIPYMNTKDCSQGFCSLYCPQWCYILIPPPPAAFVEEFPQDKSYSSPSPNFSPLVIAIIGILVSAFLLVSYYTVISKYCVNEDDRRRSAATRENHDHQNNHEFDHSPSIHEPWHVITAGGLDEALINSLPVCKYKIGDGLVEGTDCSVCLSEFEQDESLRLLPKCNHAFHLPCIDTWLKSHSNCPLCRANIALSVTQSPALTNHDPSIPLPETQTQAANDDQNSERGSSQNVALMQRDHPPISPEAPSAMRAFSDLGNAEARDHHSTIIEIGGDHHHQTIRRSVSMDDSQTSRANRVLVADIMRMNDEDEEEDDDDDDVVGRCSDHHTELSVGGGVGKCRSHTKGKEVLLHYCVINPVAMKRSLSSGRFSQTRLSRPRHTVTIPV